MSASSDPPHSAHSNHKVRTRWSVSETTSAVVVEEYVLVAEEEEVPAWATSRDVADSSFSLSASWSVLMADVIAVKVESSLEPKKYR